ncbi:MAG: hypothetical protein R3C56_02885 [Pirellulaceae bacterium]
MSSPEFRALLAELKLKYAYVVLDCPPVLPVSDPSIIAPLTDGLLFISVVKDDLKPQIERSKEILRGAGGRILGCIVNRADDAGPLTDTTHTAMKMLQLPTTTFQQSS